MNIIHAHPSTLVRAGLRAIIEKGGGINKLADAPDATTLYECLQVNKWDMVIIDHTQPESFDLNTILTLIQQHPALKILVIASDTNQHRVLSILEAGVQGYLTKECDQGEIINAIFTLGKGDNFYCNKIINLLLEKSLDTGQAETCEPTILTTRELEIVTLIAKGLTNKGIAAELFLSPHTVCTHRKNIMRKLEINSTSELVLYAVNAGLVA